MRGQGTSFTVSHTPGPVWQKPFTQASPAAQPESCMQDTFTQPCARTYTGLEVS
jgi:hypothetical protein